MYDYYGYPAYVSVSEKKSKAARKLKIFQKKNPEAIPIKVTGNKIAHSFWGKAWCDNLKTYADYDNRIGRGRSYVKNGFVFDVKIDPGRINGIVCGSSSKLYKVKIKIKKISDNCLIKQIGGSIENLEDLSKGQFPQDLAKTFLTRENGLFPNLKEIDFNCSCPDWAVMCKHVSAVLYAVGAKLDTDPLLLFTLRGIDTEDLIKKSVKVKMQALLKNADKAKSKRIIEDEDVGKLFGL